MSAGDTTTVFTNYRLDKSQTNTYALTIKLITEYDTNVKNKTVERQYYEQRLHLK